MNPLQGIKEIKNFYATINKCPTGKKGIKFL